MLNKETETPFILERTFNASVEKVWQALTDNEQMKQWYFPLADFKPETGFEFQFSGKGSTGEEYLHHCRVTEVIPLKKIQYSWRYENYEGNSFVTWELFPENGKTKIRLTHSGLESFKNNGPDFMQESFTKGWTYFMDKALRDFFEK